MDPLYMLQVSTHGNLQNQILVWKYPSLTQLANLTGHSSGVLHMAVSPDGEAIVTGAGVKALHFWTMFSKAHSQKVSAQFIHWRKIFLMDHIFFKMAFILTEIYKKIFMVIFKLLF
jgi:WD40 repeat protein